MAVRVIAAPPLLPPFRSASSQFILLRPPPSAPNASIHALNGAITNLRQFRGKVVVLNFWATWCAPCVYEIPSLNRLAAKIDPSRLAVIAVSIDRDGAAAVTPFVTGHQLTHLPIYLDPDQRLGSLGSNHVDAGALPLWGLPVTYILDKEGRAVGYLTGAAKWDSPEADAFLGYFLAQPAP